MKKKINIIGSGFSALSASCYLAKSGYEVTLFEKNDTIGGRARQYRKDGFTFDIGPTWYWMPDVFERFFADFGHKPSDYYSLLQLDPAYSVYFDRLDSFTVEGSLDRISAAFEREEKGSAMKLGKFMRNARENYDIAIKDLVYNPGISPLELVSPKTIRKLHQFVGNISSDVRKTFTNERLVRILEFPVLFLGAKASNTPSFYNFMNYADFGLGTWHPEGGMYKVVEGMATLARSLGVRIVTDANVQKIVVKNGSATGIMVDGAFHGCDIVLSGADYHHTESLLETAHRQYSEAYWNRKTFAPSSLLFYVGFKKKIEKVEHHTLFFDVDFDRHAASIYDNPHWPEQPLFYASFPSKTDSALAPDGRDSGIFLIPIAPGIEDSPAIRDKYFDKIMKRLEHLTDQSVREHILFQKSYCVEDFKQDYNAYKGNAYGLANTLMQTAFLRPKLKSKKVKGLYFTGQLTVPGPGVPPSLISGKLTSELIKKYK